MQKESDELSQSILELNGVGKKTAELFEQLNIKSVFDLLSTIPSSFSDKTEIESIDDVSDGDTVVVSGEIVKAVRTKGFRPNFIITVKGDSGSFTVRFIHKIIIFMNLQIGMKIRVDGRALKKRNTIEFIHPEIEIIEKNNKLCNIVPRYSTKGRITQSKIRKLILQAFNKISKNYKYTQLDNYFNDNFNSMSLLKAFKKLHFPEGDYNDAISEYANAKKRLVYEEIYLNKHELLNNLSSYEKKQSFKISTDNNSVSDFIASLPFSLTLGQDSALDSISRSMESNSASRVLIQGDVGCGKTIVALIACLNTIKNGFQCLVLVPTEVLCNQHFKTFSMYLSKHGKISMITGNQTTLEKERIKSELITGQVSILICTHAILYNDYKFQSLALVIIDEQHKFGVKQREKISSFSKQPHLIYMSATPIPRTLALVLYENMNYIKITDKPDGRHITKTKVFSDKFRDNVYGFVKKHLDEGTQVYWVCTRVDDNPENNLLSVELFSEVISKEFPNHQTAILHGKTPSDQKTTIINDFKKGKIKILIATSVIEVGIDCQNANCLVVENSEMFGLSQLHQLRGRVGRGKYQGHCYLMHSENIKDESIEKLRYLETHDSGFDIAEFDLKNRGTGSYLGTKQSGLPDNYKVSTIYDIMENIDQIKKFTYELPSAKISILKRRWKITKINEIQL